MEGAPSVLCVTVTEADAPRCSWCRRLLPPAAPTGRPRRYCRRSCRQRAFEARRRLQELTWGEGRLQELLRDRDEAAVAAQVLADVVGEMGADVADGRDWDATDREELVVRLASVLGDLQRAVTAR